MQNISSVIILDNNPNSSEIIKSYLSEFCDSEKIFTFQNYSDGLHKIEQNPNTLVIADFSSLNESENKIVEQIKQSTTKLIITSVECTTDMIIKALRAGAKEFIPKPVLKEDLQRAVKEISEYKECNNKNSKIISVYSNKGGIGKTTIAVNLASEIAKVTGDKTALIDLNLQLGDVSTFLNLSPSFDTGYVIRKLISNSDIQVENLFEQYKDTSLYVLSDPNYIEQSAGITPQQIEKLFYKLTEFFPYIIVDLSSNIDPNTLKILDLSDWILFTSIVNIPSIRNAQRCLNLFKSRNYPKDKVKIVINRYMENDDINIDDIENTLDEKVYWKIPNNYYTIMEAINSGVSVWEVNPNSNIGTNFREFASKVSDEIVEQSILQYRK